MFLIFVVFASALPTGHQNAYVLVSYYTAGGNITGFRTGWRLPDYVRLTHSWGSPRWCLPPGYDGNLLAGLLVGWPIILFLTAERLRNLGATFADVASYRLKQGPIRVLSACGFSGGGGALPYRPDGDAGKSSCCLALTILRWCWSAC